MEDVFFLTDFHRVAGIVSPLGPKDPVSLASHDIEDFPFSLIPPLEAKNNRYVGFQVCLRPQRGSINNPVAVQPERRRCSWALG